MRLLRPPGSGPRVSRAGRLRHGRQRGLYGRADSDSGCIDSRRMGQTETLTIEMPAMGESVTEGTVLEWHVAVGDQISEGDTVVEISTDKVDAEVPAPADGTITKLNAEPDDVIEVGSPLAEMEPGEGGGNSESATSGDGDGAAEGASGGAASAAASDGASGDGAAADGADADVAATPLARRIAADRGISLGRLTGSGPGGKVTKEDVLNGAEGGNGSGPAAAAAAGEEKALRGPAAMLAKAMNESRQVPTATSFRTIAVDTLDAKRKALNAALAAQGMKLSFTHLIAWAIVQAAREWPAMVRTYTERDGKQYMLDGAPVNLGIAVDVERKDGTRALMVPAIKAADSLAFPAFHSYYEDLITKTRENSLTADDFQGTNITLTNPGGLGTSASVPRLMAGQGTIIAAGSIAYPPEWAHATAERIKQLGVSKVTTLTSTYDHRIIQGAESGSFLGAIERLLQGEDEFYEEVARQLNIEPATATNAYPA